MRTPVTLKIKFKSASLDQFIERYSVDVSRGGIFIRTKDPLTVGTQLKFEFQLQDAQPLISGEGTVVWIREHDPTRTGVAPGMGVRFDRLAPQSQQVLDRILAKKGRGEGKLDGVELDQATRVAGDMIAGFGPTQGAIDDRARPRPMSSSSFEEADEVSDSGAFDTNESTRVMLADQAEALAQKTREASRRPFRPTAPSILRTAASPAPTATSSTQPSQAEAEVPEPEAIAGLSTAESDEAIFSSTNAPHSSSGSRASKRPATAPRVAAVASTAPPQGTSTPVPLTAEAKAPPVEPTTLPPPIAKTVSFEHLASSEGPASGNFQQDGVANLVFDAAGNDQATAAKAPSGDVQDLDHPQPEAAGLPSEGDWFNGVEPTGGGGKPVNLIKPRARVVTPSSGSKTALASELAAHRGGRSRLALVASAALLVVGIAAVMMNRRGGSGSGPESTAMKPTTGTATGTATAATADPALKPTPVSATTKESPRTNAPVAPDVEPLPTGISAMIQSKPEGARVFVDDQEQSGMTPTHVDGLEAKRSYSIRVALKGHKEFQTKLLAKAGAQVTATLRPLSHWIDVQSTPAGALLFLDGKRVGTTPMVLKNVDMDKPHKIELRRTGFEEASRSISQADSWEDKQTHTELALALALTKKEAGPNAASPASAGPTGGPAQGATEAAASKPEAARKPVRKAKPAVSTESGERPIETTAEAKSVLDGAGEKAGDKGADKAGERGEKPAEKPAERASEKPDEPRAIEPGAGSASEKAGEKGKKPADEGIKVPDWMQK